MNFEMRDVLGDSGPQHVSAYVDVVVDKDITHSHYRSPIRRSLSLLCSLIDQVFITVCRFLGKGE